MLESTVRCTLLMAARQSIEQSLAGREYTPENIIPDSVLHAMLASFVTLKRYGILRGCIGTLEPRRALLHDVIANARAAAFADPRFPPLTGPEMESLHIEISVLSNAEPIQADNRKELLLALKPHKDGLIVQEGKRRATFLPSVWSTLSDPGIFYDALMTKAGLDKGHWSPNLKFFRYHTECFAQDT
jgi:AmmeMemoRadiSam system protein A